MSELLEKVTAGDPQCVHAHLLEAELHLERRQYAAALFSARNAHALHRSVRSYRSRSDAQAPMLHSLTRCCSALVKTYLGQSRSKDALVVAKVPQCLQAAMRRLWFLTLPSQQELMENQPRSARALVVMVRRVCHASVKCVTLRRRALRSLRGTRAWRKRSALSSVRPPTAFAGAVRARITRCRCAAHRRILRGGRVGARRHVGPSSPTFTTEKLPDFLREGTRTKAKATTQSRCTTPHPPSFAAVPRQG